MTNKHVIIITGVSSGIGLSTALLFMNKGWIVVGTVRRKDYPQELAVAAVDVQLAEMTKEADIERVVTGAVKTYGRIDAVVANAGYAMLGPLESVSHQQLSDQLAVNVVAAGDLARLTLPIMRQQNHGSIVGVSSIAGRVGIPGHSAYCASKFALEGLYESVSQEVKNTGIRVRLIEPSSVKTPFWSRGVVRAAIKRRTAASETVTKSVKGGQHSELSSDKVASVIYAAVISESDQLHYPVGLTMLAVIGKRVLPDRVFRRLVSRYF